MSFRALIAPLLLATLLTGGCDRQSPPAGQANAADTALADNAIETGTGVAVANDGAPTGTAVDIIGTLDRTHRGEAALPVAFKDPAGKTVTLADFKGKPVLLNLWATWCAPCVAEMPTLDAAALALGDKAVVLAVSEDLDGAAKVMPFFAKGNFKALKPYTDDQTALSVAYQANLPTSILFDSSGHEVWRMTGGMDWTTPTARDLVAEAK